MKDKDRDPGFFTGLYASDFMAIGIAFMFSLGGMYLLFRMLFGPSLFEPAVQAQIKAINEIEAREAPAPVQTEVHTAPGEVGMGIFPAAKPPTQKKPNSP
ncbi:MAG TPA: hypothetical protein VGM68_03065 [Rhizomicrobium sp.]|jgi:hypothetical protein